MVFVELHLPKGTSPEGGNILLKVLKSVVGLLGSGGVVQLHPGLKGAWFHSGSATVSTIKGEM